MTTALESKFQCPGETYPISRSVHLARLAAFYPKCRECCHRTETGQIAQRTVAQLRSTQHRVQRDSLLTDEGIRGVYLNELTRAEAAKFAGALVSLLWQDAPVVARSDSSGTPASRSQRRLGLMVVIGHDERPFAPDLVTGVGNILRNMGCQVIDIGLTTRPAFWFAVDHLQAAAGIHVSGSGCDPVWTGLDFTRAAAQPISRGAMLEQIEQRSREGFSRPTRQPGRQRVFQVHLPYEAGLWKHFHALRPLRVVCGCPSNLVSNLLQRTFAKLPCRLLPVDIPSRRRIMTDPADADCIHIGQSVRRRRAHLGVLIDDDGQTCAFFDQRGQHVSGREMTRLLVDLVLQEHSGGNLVLESSAADLAESFSHLGARPIEAGTTLASVSATMREHAALFAGGNTGRYWFRESFPTCDALLSVAKVVQALSRSDADFSEVLVRLATG